MESNLLLIHKSILPKIYFQVIEARELIERENLSVVSACKKTGISRNTFYKYKDYIFRPKDNLGKKAIISFKVDDTKGVLSNILGVIHECGGNIIAINQDAPIHSIAYIVITIDVIELNIAMEELVDRLKMISDVKAVNVISYE